MLKRINSNKENQRIQRSLSSNSHLPTSPYSRESRKRSPCNVLKTCENTMASTNRNDSKIQHTMKVSALEKENFSLRSLLSEAERTFKLTLSSKEKEIRKLNKIILDLVKKNEATQQKLREFTPRKKIKANPTSDSAFLVQQLNLLDEKLKEAENLSNLKGKCEMNSKERSEVQVHKSNFASGNIPIPSTIKVLSIAEISKLTRFD